MNRIRKFLDLLRTGAPEQNHPQITAADGAMDAETALPVDIEGLPDALRRWCRHFPQLPLLSRYALLHHFDPAATKEHFLVHLRRHLHRSAKTLPDADFRLVLQWEKDDSESLGLDLANAIETFGLESSDIQFQPLAETIRLIALSTHNVGWRIPDSPGLEAAVAQAASHIAENLMRDCRTVQHDPGHEPSLLRLLATISIGWTATASSMMRFRGKTHTFNHLAYQVGEDLARHPDVLIASLAEEAETGTPRDTMPRPADDFSGADFDDGLLVPGPPPPVEADDPFRLRAAAGDAATGDSDTLDFTRLDAEDGERRNASAWSADDPPGPAYTPDPPGHPAVQGPSMFVCVFKPQQQKDRRTRELIDGHKEIIGTKVDLAEVPDLFVARNRLLFEFPYAEEAIDQILNELVNRTTVRLGPVVLLGPPGAGKSRVVRRLGAILDTHVWRVDCTRSDGNSFGGTDRRWASSEPSHPFLAISRARQANPIILLDEIEKASTRTDYGRLWDVLLGFLDHETAHRYPDPALQAEVDLSQVSYVATANYIESIPHPLRDRFQVIEFPEPGAEHLDALLGPVFEEYIERRNLDPRWVPPLLPFERDAIAGKWKGGSIRKLSRFLHAVMRARDKASMRH